MATLFETRRKPTLAAIAGLVSMLFSGCQRLNQWLGITDPWANYRDPTVNFIAKLGFDQQDQTAQVETPALWTWAWRTSPATDANSWQYMTMDPAVGRGRADSLGTVPTGLGLDPAAPAYLLDLPNLLPAADSDFEGQAVPMADWQRDPDTSSTQFSSHQISTTPSVISGNNSLLLSLQSRVGLSLRLGSLVDSGIATGSHGYLFRLQVLGLLYYKFGNWGQTLESSGTTSDSIKLNNPPTIVSDERLLQTLEFTPASPPALFFGSTSTPIESTIIDNVRALRSDLQGFYRIRLLLRPDDPNPRLARGIWSFVVYVLVPTARSFVSESAAANPYAAQVITLSMDQLQPPELFRQSFTLDSTAKGTWQRLELKMQKGGTNYGFDDTLIVPVIELAITPTIPEQPDAGGILVAQPELHFFL
jgi:hypothetical protein